MSKSASRPAEKTAYPLDNAESAASGLGWKQEVNQRLAAHRNRRGSATDNASDSERSGGESQRPGNARAAEAAARVAARYAKAPSYSQLLASEARAVVRAAGVAAEAARDAQAAAELVLAGLESAPIPAAWHGSPAMADPEMPARWQDEPPAAEASASSAWAGAQPRWEEALPVQTAPPAAGRVETEQDVWAEMRVHSRETEKKYRYEAEEFDLFPADALAGATVEPIQHLPANLIEFPRELVAPRKARPRLAEGPFAPQESSQLSIFEVDPEFLAPPTAMNSAGSQSVAPPEWASIELEQHPAPTYHHGPVANAYAQPVDGAVQIAEESYAVAEASIESIMSIESIASMPDYSAAPMTDAAGGAVAVAAEIGSGDVFAAYAPVPAAREFVRESVKVGATASPVELLVAPMSDRLLASVIDGALVALAYLAAAAVVIASTEHPPTGRIAVIASVLAVGMFFLMYQFLFLSYAEEGTPGMRYARIALCTFTDDNPTREQMRMRIPALMISALPAGLGLLWALFDGEHLSWHDRLTRTYQRKY